MLDALSQPKDRMRLARELGLDWKAVDYQIGLLNNHGLVHEEYASGRVRIYRLSESGRSLIELLRSASDRKVVDDARLVGVKATVSPAVEI